MNPKNMKLASDFLVLGDHCASNIGSGNLEVLSTPSMIAFMENTALKSVTSLLEASQTTVGIEINVQHTAPTAIGKTVHVVAELKHQLGKILEFDISAFVDDQEIGHAQHKRAIVNAEKFMGQIQ